jgi:hypothetical protein
MRGFNFSLSGQLTALRLHKGSQIHSPRFESLQPNSLWRVGEP